MTRARSTGRPDERDGLAKADAPGHGVTGARGGWTSPPTTRAANAMPPPRPTAPRRRRRRDDSPRPARRAGTRLLRGRNIAFARSPRVAARSGGARHQALAAVEPAARQRPGDASPTNVPDLTRPASRTGNGAMPPAREVGNGTGADGAARNHDPPPARPAHRGGAGAGEDRDRRQRGAAGVVRRARDKRPWR